MVHRFIYTPTDCKKGKLVSVIDPQRVAEAN
jgi:hypothetical protein